MVKKEGNGRQRDQPGGANLPVLTTWHNRNGRKALPSLAEIPGNK